jgi:hypothetical protein
MIYQGWKEWADKYRPIKNKFSKYPDEVLFESTGKEGAFVSDYDQQYVWTILQGESSVYIGAGNQTVNRIGLFITEVAWKNQDDTCLLSVDDNCSCYREEGYDNGDFGDEDCDKCEGYGSITRYIGEQSEEHC